MHRHAASTVGLTLHAARFSMWMAGASAAALCVAAAPAQAQAQYWDGPNQAPQGNPEGSGGDGDWTVDGTNWTNVAGTANTKWQGGKAVFAGPAANPVRVIGDHLVTGVVFRSNYALYAENVIYSGNTLTSATGSLQIAGMTGIEVQGGVSASIGAPITGAGGIAKTGAGTLILAGPNFFTGNVEINAGQTIVTGGQLALGSLINGRTITVNGNDTLLRFEGGGSAVGPINYYNYATGNGGIVFSAGSRNYVPGGNASIYNYGRVTFMGDADAGGLSIFNQDGALLDFTEDSLPYLASINNAIGGTVQFGYLNAPEVRVRELNSGGTVWLDGKRLIIEGQFNGGSTGGGGNISGGLQDGGPAGGSGAWLVVRGDSTNLGLGGASTYTGGTFVEGGVFYLFGTIRGDVLVTGGTFVGGNGDVAGNVVVTGAQSTLYAASGSNPNLRENIGLVTMGMQTLTLSNGAHFRVYLSAPYPLGTQNALGPFNVRGDVSLSGTLDVADNGTQDFGNGLYRLITYGGALSGSGLVFGEVPNDYFTSHFTIQTSIAGQVNLIVNRPLAVIDRLFWDGDAAGSANNQRVDGGSGTWTTASTNWTTADGASNGIMSPQPGFVIFAGAPGTVTASNGSGQVSVSGMQFASNGYTLTGGPIALAGADPVIRVGEGTGAGASYTATIAAPLTGTGGLVKSDLGTLILTGTSSYSGATRVAFGTLVVNGTITSPVTVESGAFLRGTGRVGSTQILAGATIAPGNSIGTLTVAGNIGFAAGSAYQVEVTTAASDRINATGTAAFAGGTVGVIATPGAYARQARYTILNATGGVGGTFAGATSNLVYLAPRLEYDANNAYLVLSLDDGFSGEIHSSLKAVLVDDSRFVREAALDRLRDGGGPGLWLRGVGAWGHWDGVGEAARVDRSLAGALGGADLVTGPVRLGLIGGYTRTDIDIDARQSTATTTNIHAGAYAGARWRHVGLRLGAARSWHKIATDRVIRSGNFADATHARYDAGTSQAFGELSFSLDAGPVTFGPFGAIAYVRLETDGFAEHGGAASLVGAASATDTTFSTLGLRSEFDLGGSVGLHVGGGWRHAFDERATPTRIAFADGSSFDIQGVPIAEDAVALDAALDVRIRDNIGVGMRYGGQISDRATDHSVKVDVMFRF